jgi:hypothetical protein
MDNLRIRLNPMLAASGRTNEIKLFTIDVATGPKTIYNGINPATPVTTTYVRLGLGSQRITMTSMTADVELGSTNALGSELGDFALLGMIMDIDGSSTVDIYAHDGAGITIDLDVKIDQIHFNSMAWGDSDGLGTNNIHYNAASAAAAAAGDGLLSMGATTSRGYVGIRAFQINNMTITGQIKIDVATINAGLTPAANGLLGVYREMLDLHAYDGGTTGVLIRMDNLNIRIQNMNGFVTLSNDTALSPANSRDLGEFYMDNVNVTVNGWVGIFAH